MNHKCIRCDKTWQTDSWGGFFDQNHNPICLECSNKEMDEYHRRRIENLNHDILETNIVKGIIERLNKLEEVGE
jgi:hypothetical protein